MTKLWPFYQNNSGGFYTNAPKVIMIEADTHYQANKRAKKYGIYFGHRPVDCAHCGDRWRKAYDHYIIYWGGLFHHYYGEEYDDTMEVETCTVYYLNGTTENLDGELR